MSSHPTPTIIVFDSGVGGLTVLRGVMALRPDAHYRYIADDAGFPYGGLDDDTLVARVLAIMNDEIATRRPALVVIACNTASTIALPALRTRFTVPFVGTVPAIKPACAASDTKRVSVLGTEATVRREYTRALIREFGNGADVALVGSARLAAFGEAELQGEPASDADLSAEIGPCFIDVDGRRTDTIVLACTHYPLLLDRFKRLAPWPVQWIDPAPAIARRVDALLQQRPAASERPPAPSIVFTSGREPPAALAHALKRFGFRSPFQEVCPRT